MFFQVKDNKKEVKEIISVDCGKRVPRYFDSEKIFLLKRYKALQSKGRKDTLKGMDVLAFQTEKGTFLFPVEQLEQMANCLYSLSLSLKANPPLETVCLSDDADELEPSDSEE